MASQCQSIANEGCKGDPQQPLAEGATFSNQHATDLIISLLKRHVGPLQCPSTLTATICKAQKLLLLQLFNPVVLSRVCVCVVLLEHGCVCACCIHYPCRAAPYALCAPSCLGQGMPLAGGPLTLTQARTCTYECVWVAWYAHVLPHCANNGASGNDPCTFHFRCQIAFACPLLDGFHVQVRSATSGYAPDLLGTAAGFFGYFVKHLPLRPMVTTHLSMHGACSVHTIG